MNEGHRWRDRLDEHLAVHHGVVAVERAVALGAPRRTIYSDVERGRLRVLLPGVLVSHQWPLGRMQRIVAACAANPLAVVAFTSAARLWELRRIPRDVAVHVLVPHRCSSRIAGTTVHRCRRIDAVDIVDRGDGIRLTSPPRTIFDCADMLGFEATSSVLEQIIETGRGTFETHLATWVRLAHPRRPGTRTMTAVLRSRPAWRTALQSDLEARVLDEIVAQGLPAPEVQHPLRLEGRSIRLDLAWPEQRVALEVDHPFWHAGAEEAHRDRGRDRLLMLTGWIVPRITDVDVRTGLATSIAQLAALLEMRTAPPRSMGGS